MADLNAAVCKEITPQMQEAYKKTGAAQVVKLSAEASHKLALQKAKICFHLSNLFDQTETQKPLGGADSNHNKLVEKIMKECGYVAKVEPVPVKAKKSVKSKIKGKEKSTAPESL